MGLRNVRASKTFDLFLLCVGIKRYYNERLLLLLISIFGQYFYCIKGAAATAVNTDAKPTSFTNAFNIDMLF